MARSFSVSPSPPHTKRRRRGFIPRCERCCWTFVTHLPLAFVYGLTTWAVIVEVSLSRIWILSSWNGYVSIFIGFALYVLLNWSYTAAVFTDPGSPLAPPSSASSRAGYTHLPMHEPTISPELPSFTVKSTGGTRYCKKCQARKPDRAHHCSTCRRCVLKMDHHCPWLATCVGLRNYKPFLLFCSYTTVFCWVCFGLSTTSLWSEIAHDAQFEGGFLSANMVLLSVLSGIMGLVLAGFTGWHLSLALRGQTTIECLEKTRYLSPLRKTLQRAQLGSGEDDAGVVQRYGQQLAEIHANALPGVTRLEEGEERPSPAGDLEQGLTVQEALHMSYDERERARERERYEEYLDEQDSEKLPNAFDLGWKRNLTHLFGDKPLFWLLPICNTQGDGWHWEPSTKWLEARDEIRRKREMQWREQEERETRAGWGGIHEQPIQPSGGGSERRYLSTSNGVVTVPGSGRRSPGKADQILGRLSDSYPDANNDINHRPGSGMSMRTLRQQARLDRVSESGDHYEVSSDEEEGARNAFSSGRQSKLDKKDASMLSDGGEEEWREWE